MITDIFTKLNSIKTKKYHEQYRSPILLFQTWKEQKFVSYTKLTTNPELKQYDFAKLIDPYTAHQEISNWISNLARPQPKIPQIDDLTMSEIKGFDKYSFRKDKSK